MPEILTEIMDEEWNCIKVTFAEPWEIPWTVLPGERDDYEIHFLEKGKGRFLIGGREFSVTKGDIVCLHSLEGNSFVPDELPFRFIFTTFSLEYPKYPDKVEKLNQLLSREKMPFKSVDTQKVQELLYRLHKEMTLKLQGYMFRAKLILGELASALANQCGDAGSVEGIRLNANRKNHYLINRAMIFLQENYNRDISLEDLGRLVNLHPRYLCGLFRQVKGKTVSEFLKEIRIEKAKRLLLYTSLSITDIAMESGFGSSQYFSRVFGQEEGMDPRTYRKTKRK